MTLDCPECKQPHVDEGEWATRPHKTHQCQHCGHEWRPFDYPTVGVQARPDGGEAFAMLVAVAKAAHRAMDSGEELANHRVMLDALEASELTNALDAMDTLPEIPDPHYVYDGWARAEYYARHPTPAPDAVARLVEARECIVSLRQHLALFCGPDDAIAQAIFAVADRVAADLKPFTAAQQEGES